MIINPKIIGVLNVTQDSFSDGGIFFEKESAVARAEQLIKEGAFCIDVGGDSTRPGSVCVGIEEEWRRIAPVIKALAGKSNLSVDTHHTEVARRAIESGAEWINDISSGQDPGMYELVAKTGVKFIITYTRCSKPHVFDIKPKGLLLDEISNFFDLKIEAALKNGIKKEQIIIDPGMGAFLSDDANVSFELLRSLAKFDKFDFPLMLSASRKGFLRSEGEKQVKDRDAVSAFAACYAAIQCEYRRPQFIRAHNVSLHRDFISTLWRCAAL